MSLVCIFVVSIFIFRHIRERIEIIKRNPKDLQEMEQIQAERNIDLEALGVLRADEPRKRKIEIFIKGEKLDIYFGSFDIIVGSVLFVGSAIGISHSCPK